MKEEQIDPIPFRPHSESLLTSNECKIIPQLEQELLQLPYKRFFQFCLGVFVFQSEKFKNKRIFDLKAGGILCGAMFAVASA